MQFFVRDDEHEARERERAAWEALNRAGAHDEVLWHEWRVALAALEPFTAPAS